jgi:hypothetical protein
VVAQRSCFCVETNESLQKGATGLITPGTVQTPPTNTEPGAQTIGGATTPPVHTIPARVAKQPPVSPPVQTTPVKVVKQPPVPAVLHTMPPPDAKQVPVVPVQTSPFTVLTQPAPVALTEAVVEAEADWPELSVTVRVTVNVPGLVYVLLTTGPMPMVPSPNAHENVRTVPVLSPPFIWIGTPTVPEYGPPGFAVGGAACALALPAPIPTAATAAATMKAKTINLRILDPP